MPPSRCLFRGFERQGGAVARELEVSARGLEGPRATERTGVGLGAAVVDAKGQAVCLEVERVFSILKDSGPFIFSGSHMIQDDTDLDGAEDDASIIRFVNQVLKDVVRCAQPRWAEVEGLFAARGGIEARITARFGPVPK